ncbi:unnamed protein product [Lactuca virosa]|uniref:Uncharacterized protein n=1 Tax=Lactuca virosa TaxID=75947 RepID=A0AAU9LR67_9ASTR|nr:unnamed protein product [Lactuca virosa]
MMAREREEEIAFRKAMLTWMKQQDPEFFSDISSFPDSIVTLLEPVVDDAPGDTSFGISDSSCTSPVTHVPMSEGFVCFSGGNSTPNTSEEEVESFPWVVKNKKLAEFNGYDISLVTPEPVIECSECLSDDNSIPKSSELVESLPETLERDSKTPPPFLIPPSPPPSPPPWFETSVKGAGRKQEKPNKFLSLILRDRENSDGEVPGAEKSVIEEQRATDFHVERLTEHQRSTWEKAAPFNNRLEWGYLGYPSNGLKNDNWAEIDSWGSQLLNGKIDLVLMSKQNISPLVNWNENNDVYHNQLPSPSPTPAMAYVFQRDRRVRSSSRTEWKEQKKKGLSLNGGSQVGLSHKCHKCKEDCNHYSWDANQVLIDQLSKKASIGSCQILEFVGVVANSQSIDMISIMELLLSLSEMTYNWDKAWMKFMYNGIAFHFQRLITGQQVQASLQQWLGTLQGGVRFQEMMKEGQEWDDFLKKSNVHSGLSFFLPPDMKTGLSFVFLVTCAFENRLDQIHNWLIQWKGRPDGEATRKVVLNIMSQFKEASLEDKTCFEGVSNDTDPNMVVKREK